MPLKKQNNNLLCFLAISFILTDYAQNYAHKFNEIMCMCVVESNEV